MMTNDARKAVEMKKRLVELARCELRAKKEEVRVQERLLMEMERELRAFEAAAWRR